MKPFFKILLAAAIATAPAHAAPLIAAGGDRSLVARDDGNLWQFGDFPGPNDNEPKLAMAGRMWSALGCSSGSAAGIDSVGALWTWTSQAPVRVGTDSDWRTLSGASNYSLAIRTDGTLWKLGSSSTPVQFGTDSNWKSAVGGIYNLAIRTDGSLWGWGANNHGSVGDGTKITRTDPVPVGSGIWSSVAIAGYYTSFGVQADGSRWAWGDNNGRFGDGANDLYSLIPVKIGTDTDWRKICGTQETIVALKTDGSLWTWGERQGTPVRIGTASTWTDVVAGDSHFLATRSDGSIWGWGDNHSGQLGVSGISSSEEPIDITGAFEPKPKCVIYENGHPVSSYQNHGYWSLPIGILRETSPFEIQIRNDGAAPLTLSTSTATGFTIEVPASLPMQTDGVIRVTLPTAQTGQFSGDVALTTNDPARPTFTLQLSATVVSPADDTDGDGLNDAVEVVLIPLGFNWNYAQPELVAALFQNVGFAGLYRPEDVLDLPAAAGQPEFGGSTIRIPLDLGPLPLDSGNVAPLSTTRLRIDVPLPEGKKFLRLGHR